MSNLNFVGAPNFVPPTSPARRSSSGPRRSRRGSAATIDPRLPIIDEDRPSPPLAPPPQEPVRTHHRPFSRRFLGDPPLYSNKVPPTYTFHDVVGPKGEKFEDLRDNKFIAGRGGFKKLCIIALVVLLVVVALVVGLAVGLSKKNSSSSAPASSNTTSSGDATAPTGPFPVGSWTFTTFLSTVSTNCTSNPKSWTCEPSQTFAQSPSGAKAMFNWIITQDSPAAKTFSISSANNPFAITFANASLTLLDAGGNNERYTFEAHSVPKTVYPSSNIKCYYNGTTFSGALYTNKPKTYPSDAASSSSTAPAASATSSTTASGGGPSQPFADWNFAVDAAQSIGGGVDVPECYAWNNGIDGARVTNGYTSEPMGSFCSCAYTNYQ